MVVWPISMLCNIQSEGEEPMEKETGKGRVGYDPGTQQENQIPYFIPPWFPNPYPPRPGDPVQLRRKEKSRRTLWISLSVAAVVLLIGSGIFAYVRFFPTPAKALDTFCSNLQAPDSQSAYKQLSSKYQQEINESKFDIFFANVSTCSYTALNQSGNSTTATLTLNRISGETSSDVVTLTQEGGNTWKINDESLLTGIVKTLDRYCPAIKKGDYTTAIKQQSKLMQQKISMVQFDSFLAQPTSCLDTLLSVSGTTATAILNLSFMASPNDQTSHTEAHQLGLVLSSGNIWQINSISNLPDEVLDTFCNDLKQKDYSTAYNQLSQRLQQAHWNSDSSAFATAYNAVTSCTHDAATRDASGNVTSQMTYSFGTGTAPWTASLIKEDAGNWIIDDLENPSYATLLEFCSDLQSQKYPSAYDLGSANYQGQYTELQFKQNYGGATCTITSFDENSVKATAKAVLALTFSHSSGKTKDYNATLISDSNGNWKIDTIEGQ